MAASGRKLSLPGPGQGEPVAGARVLVVKLPDSPPPVAPAAVLSGVEDLVGLLEQGIRGRYSHPDTGWLMAKGWPAAL